MTIPHAVRFALLLLSFPALASTPSVPPASTLPASPTRISDLVAAGEKATVVVFLSSECPCSAAHEPVLKRLYSEFSSRGIGFIGLHANQDESPEEARKHFEAADLPFPVMADVKARLADHFGALKTPHAFVVSPSGEVLFSGGVDDSKDPAKAKQFYLADALRAISEGRAPEKKTARALGCVIKR